MKLDLNPDMAPPTLVLGGAAIVGFAFLLMYEVCCRMLVPLLGSSSYASGLVLGAALLGLGAGGTCFALFAKDSPARVGRFALGCAAQALCLALPYALGDRIAVLALLMRPLGGLGLAGHVVAWAVIASIVVLPAALVAGMQLTLLVALLGRGSHRAGRHVGMVHAAAAAGGLAGALAGGLAFVPLLSATGAWRLCAAMVAALGVGAMVLAILQRQQTRRGAALTLVATAFTAGFLLLARGPTAAWRQGQVGSGSADDVAHNATRNSLRAWVHAQRARVVWSAEGRERSVALAIHDGLTLLEDGQSQGDAGRGAAAQIMGGLLGAMLHPRPARALVLGLGNGSAAGWLALVQAVERVDVIELEPNTLKVARELGALNKNVLDNPKVHVTIGDAREVVTSARDRYDLIVSQEPRPGNEAIANLFTREFYRAVAARLTDGGTFVQRLQAYEVDGHSIRTVYATLASVFPVVETWQTKLGELVLLASRQAILHSVPAMRDKIKEEPYKSALANVWRVDDLEGLVAHYVAHPALALVIAQQDGGDVSTDDKNPLEYAYARGAGRRRLFDSRELLATARYRKESRPALTEGDVDWARVEEAQIAMYVVEGALPSPLVDQGPELRRRVEVYRRYAAGLLDATLPASQGAVREPASLIELEMVSEALADAGDAAAMPLINKLMLTQPAEAGAMAARLLWRQGKIKEAADYLVPSFRLYQESPWPLPAIMRRSLDVAIEVGTRDKTLGLALYQVLQRPFAADLLQGERRRAVLELGFRIDFEKLCVEALAPFEPEVPWRRQLLTRRFQCYQAARHTLAARAQQDLEAFLEDDRAPFAQGLADASAGPLDEGQ